ncbi:MAG TPA: hypothetical protein VGC69_04795 [Bordetella sp.]
MAGMGLLMAGCADTGLMEKQAQGLSDSFTVSTDTDSAYRRGIEYVRVCHKSRPHPYGATYGSLRDSDMEGGSDDPFAFLSSDKDKDSKSKAGGRIRVYKVGQEAKILELIEARSVSVAPVETRVTVRVLGTDAWDKAELAAAHQSIQSATPTCRPLE